MNGADRAGAGVADIGILRAAFGGAEADHVRGFALGVIGAENAAVADVEEEELVGVFDGDGEAVGGGVEVDAVGAEELIELDGSGAAAGGDVDDGDGVAAFAGLLNAHGAVVGDVDEAAVGGGDHLMGMEADLDLADTLTLHGVEAEGAGSFFQDQ
ncbi:MAG: hypothetical protein IPJ98_24245 [Bryobacterales bacterium]|nr:hypothetical protein [Bryobacterales bacterium]